MSNVVDFDKDKMNTALAKTIGGTDANDDLSAGVTGGFSVMSYRGSKWRVKHDGEETLLVDKAGETMPSIRVVVLKANKNISKNYYADGYVEGSNDSPTCWSVDGIKPDPGVERPVAPLCASCPKNQFGSRITDTGSKAKACGDLRRLAVVPEGDYANAVYGGPMLLRVPAASLSELAHFGKAMKAKGWPYNTIVTRISFDPDAAYPKLKFNAWRPLTEEEANEIIGLLHNEEYAQKLDFVLATAVEIAATDTGGTAEAAQTDPTEFEGAPTLKTKAPAAAKVIPAQPATKKKEPVAKKAPEPEEEEAHTGGSEDDGLGDSLDAILSQLDDLD